MQQRLALPGPAQQVALDTVPAQLRDVAFHGFPAPDLARIVAMIAVVFATINVVGGFLVTDRMLKMFQRK